MEVQKYSKEIPKNVSPNLFPQYSKFKGPFENIKYVLKLISNHTKWGLEHESNS